MEILGHLIGEKKIETLKLKLDISDTVKEKEIKYLLWKSDEVNIVISIKCLGFQDVDSFLLRFGNIDFSKIEIIFEFFKGKNTLEEVVKIEYINQTIL